MLTDQRMLNNIPDAIAPDTMEVRLLAATERGSMAHFRLPIGAVGKAVVHKTVDELWFCLGGHSQMWLSDRERPITATVGMSFAIRAGTRFQLRNTGSEPADFVAVTMPPWPGADEAELTTGRWGPTGRT